MNETMWTPSMAAINNNHMTLFIRWINEHFKTIIEDYPSLYGWSLHNKALFWSSVWAYCRVKGELGKTPPSQWYVNDNDWFGSRWFPDARLNAAENMLRHRDKHTALIFYNEFGHRQSYSYRELYDEVARLAGALEQAGVGPGDRVAGLLPNMPVAVIAMLAANSLGAVWSSCSPDFGHQGIMDRFGQIEPKVLFCTDGYYYKGKAVDVLARVAGVVEQLACIQQVVVCPYIRDESHATRVGRAVPYQRFIQGQSAGEIRFRRGEFNHPMYIMYTSGTTGKPKCIVHGAGGTLLQHLKELVLHTNIGRDDRLFYFTTCGWMMWNWLVSGLAAGATVVLYDGSPFHPHPAHLFDMIDELGVTVFGTSAKYISALEKAGCRPVDSHSLKSMRTLLSTGSPLVPESFDYVYEQVKTDVQLSSISGGTDILSCFALGNPLLPVFRGQIQCRGLGMQVNVFNERGEPVIGEKGELVCTAPFPSMPVGFWGDPDNAKFHAAYFERFPGVWAHGDYAEITPEGGVIIYGRCDAVLNPGGVRIGTAEIYRQVEKLPEVLESLAVGQQWQGDERIVLFVVLQEGQALTDSLVSDIRRVIRAGATPRHVPAKIIQITAIPRTRSGKIVEISVRDIIHGRPVKNTQALANPDALEQFKSIPALQVD